MKAHVGFMETPDVPQMLRDAAAEGQQALALKLMDTTFYLGRETLIATRSRGHGAADGPSEHARERLATWRKRLFIVMTRNAQSATAFFGLPPNRVVELGAQIQF